MGSKSVGFAKMMAVFAAAMVGGGRYEQGRTTLRGMGLGDSYDGPRSSKNGGGFKANRAFQRAALKKRNQARHRAACKA